MLLGNRTITVIKRENGGFRCASVRNAYWNGKRGVSPGTSGDTPDGKYTVKFADCRAEDMPKPGDYVALGSVPSPASLAELAGYDYFRVTAVYDLRRGCGAVAHIKVCGE